MISLQCECWRTASGSGAEATKGAAATPQRRAELPSAERRVQHDVDGELRVVGDAEQFLDGHERRRRPIVAVNERVEARGVAREIQCEKRQRHGQQQPGDAVLVGRNPTTTTVFSGLGVGLGLHSWRVASSERSRRRFAEGQRDVTAFGDTVLEVRRPTRTDADVATTQRRSLAAGDRRAATDCGWCPRRRRDVARQRASGAVLPHDGDDDADVDERDDDERQQQRDARVDNEYERQRAGVATQRPAQSAATRPRLRHARRPRDVAVRGAGERGESDDRAPGLDGGAQRPATQRELNGDEALDGETDHVPDAEETGDLRGVGERLAGDSPEWRRSGSGVSPRRRQPGSVLQAASSR